MKLQLTADFHTHTTHSHGKGSVRDNALAARDRGLLAVGIADHGPRMLPWIAIKSLDVFDAIRREAEAASAELGIEVLVGCECNLIDMDGQLDVPLSVLRDLDFVLAGFHKLIRPPSLGAAWGLVGRNWLARYSRAADRRARLENTKAMVKMVDRYPIDVITHPGLHINIDTAELARACAATGTALELNAGHGELSAEFVRLALQEGVDFVVGSDAHSPGRVGDVEPVLNLIRELGLPLERVRNVHDPDHPRREGGPGGALRWLRKGIG